MSKKIQVNSKLQKYATNFFRILSVCMVPIAAFVPSVRLNASSLYTL